MDLPNNHKGFYELIGNLEKIKRFPHFKLFNFIKNNIFNLLISSNLSIAEILEIGWFWSLNTTVKDTVEQTGLSNKTIIRWFKKFRIYCYYKMLTAQPMGGPGYSIQIDESLFRGTRKYNRVRLLKGDLRPDGPSIKKMRKRLKLRQKTNNCSDKESKRNNRNYGNRIVGPWVFGMVVQKISDIEEDKSLKSNNYNASQNIMKEKGMKCNQNSFDTRQLNTKENRVYNRSVYK